MRHVQGHGSKRELECKHDSRIDWVERVQYLDPNLGGYIEINDDTWHFTYKGPCIDLEPNYTLTG